MVSDVQGATVKFVSLKKLVHLSTNIFYGRVIDQSVLEDQNTLWTQTTFEIIDGWKGSLKKGQEWTLTQRGGEIGEGISYKRIYIPGLPTFTLNEEVVLFVEKAPAGSLVVAGMTQGKYTVEQTSKGLYARRQLKGVYLYKARAQDQIKTFAHLPSNLSDLPLTTLKALIFNQIRPQKLSSKQSQPTPILKVIRPSSASNPVRVREVGP